MNWISLIKHWQLVNPALAARKRYVNSKNFADKRVDTTFIRTISTIILIHCCLNTFAYADAANIFSTIASWQGDTRSPSLTIPLASTLTAKQRNIITGGFTTVSQLTIYLAKNTLDQNLKPSEDDLGQKVAQVRCSVKFDAWEETFDVARLEQTPRVKVFKEFSDYAQLCLTAHIDLNATGDPQLQNRLMQSGGIFFALLTIKQTSAEEAARIRDWLIQQQSGVMQGLFSHMLGELMFSQSVIIRIDIPPVSPLGSERRRRLQPSTPASHPRSDHD